MRAQSAKAKHPYKDVTGFCQREAVSKKKLCFSASILLLFLLATLPSLSQTLDPARCAASHQWIEVNKDHLPVDIAELSKYPSDQRMAIIAALDPHDRSRLWREHFESHLAKDRELTVEQRQILEEASALMTPDFFSSNTQPPAELAALFERAQRAFGSEVAKQLFTTIGTADFPPCACATPPGDLCPAGQFCDDTASCNPRPGCGPGGRYICNGMCAKVNIICSCTLCSSHPTTRCLAGTVVMTCADYSASYCE